MSSSGAISCSPPTSCKGYDPMRWFPSFLLGSLASLLIVSATTISTLHLTTSKTAFASRPAHVGTETVPPTSGISSNPSQSDATGSVSATLRAYTVTDSIDRDYHAKHGTRTADGSDTSKVPYGIAGPRELLGRHVILCVPGFRPYDTPKIWRIDDTGGMLRRRYADTGILQFELRFTSSEEATRFGVQDATVVLLDY